MAPHSSNGRDDKGRFAKGTTGNPNGRPPSDQSFTALLRAKVAERPQLFDRFIALAESADENVSLRALIAIANRLDGMPRQATEQTCKDGGDIRLVWFDGSEA